MAQVAVLVFGGGGGSCSCSCRWPCSAEDGAGAVEAGGERRAGAWRSAERAAPEERTTSGGAADGKIRQPDGRRLNFRALVLSENEELGEEEEAEQF